MSTIVQDIILSLEQYYDPKRKELAKTYYPTKAQVIGVTNPNIKIVLKEVKFLTKNWEQLEKIKLAIALCKTDIFECIMLAYDYIGKDKKLLAALNKSDIAKLATHLDNWVLVDTYSVYVHGCAWQLGTITNKDILTLYKSSNVWLRRVAIVSSVSLNLKSRGGTGDVNRTLMICSLAVNDHEDMINKAMSWALRELSKRDKQVVYDFIEKHRDSLHKRVLREVTNKLVTGTKN